MKKLNPLLMKQVLIMVVGIRLYVFCITVLCKSEPIAIIAY